MSYLHVYYFFDWYYNDKEICINISFSIISTSLRHLRRIICDLGLRKQDRTSMDVVIDALFVSKAKAAFLDFKHYNMLLKQGIQSNTQMGFYCTPAVCLSANTVSAKMIDLAKKPEWSLLSCNLLGNIILMSQLQTCWPSWYQPIGPLMTCTLSLCNGHREPTIYNFVNIARNNSVLLCE